MHVRPRNLVMGLLAAVTLALGVGLPAAQASAAAPAAVSASSFQTQPGTSFSPANRAVPGMENLSQTGFKIDLAKVKYLSKRQVVQGSWCLPNAEDACILGQGAGNQVVLGTSLGSNFLRVDQEAIGGGFTAYQVENNNGFCLREGSGNMVKLQNGTCDPSNQDNWWIFENSGLKVNLHDAPDTMYTGNSNIGTAVWSGNPANHPGAWTNWKFPTPN